MADTITLAELAGALTAEGGGVVAGLVHAVLGGELVAVVGRSISASVTDTAATAAYRPISGGHIVVTPRYKW